MKKRTGEQARWRLLMRFVQIAIIYTNEPDELPRQLPNFRLPLPILHQGMLMKAHRVIYVALSE